MTHNIVTRGYHFKQYQKINYLFDMKCNPWLPNDHTQPVIMVKSLKQTFTNKTSILSLIF